MDENPREIIRRISINLEKASKDIMGLIDHFEKNQGYFIKLISDDPEMQRIFDKFIKGKFTILGMNIENLVDLRGEYMRRNGKFPMTSESIKEVFSHA